MPPAHSPPPPPQFTCFQVHNPWAGIACCPPPSAAGAAPLHMLPPSAHPAISPGHPAALSCGVSPPGKASAPPADVMSPCDTLGETLGRCPLCATVNRFTSIPLWTVATTVSPECVQHSRHLTNKQRNGSANERHDAGDSRKGGCQGRGQQEEGMLVLGTAGRGHVRDRGLGSKNLEPRTSLRAHPVLVFTAAYACPCAWCPLVRGFRPGAELWGKQASSVRLPSASRSHPDTATQRGPTVFGNRRKCGK